MKKKSQTLPQAIKTIVDKYGKDVLNDIQLVNIMSDVVNLEDSLAVKNTLRELIKLGYGKKILSLVSAKGDNVIKIRVYSKSIADTQGYKEVIVQYILYSLAYSVGICQEPHLKNVESKPKQEVSTKIPYDETKNSVGITNFPKLILGIIVIILLWGGIYLYKYTASSNDREQFNERIFSGNTFMDNGDYAQAVESYKDAYNGYNAMNSSSYKEEALGKIDALTDKLYREGQTDNKSLLQAHQLTKSAMQLNLEKNERAKLETKLEDIEKLITEKVINGHQQLINNISTNNGNLDESGKNKLVELLELSPNDYWLNRIKENFKFLK